MTDYKILKELSGSEDCNLTKLNEEITKPVAGILYRFAESNNAPMAYAVEEIVLEWTKMTMERMEEEGVEGLADLKRKG